MNIDPTSPQGPRPQADAAALETSRTTDARQHGAVAAATPEEQLVGVAVLLEDIELRVQGALRLFDGGPGRPDRASSASRAYNPDASFEGVEIRQAAVDAAFAGRIGGREAATE